MTASHGKKSLNDLLQDFNDILHHEPYSIIAHGLFWTLFLFSVPFAGVGVIFLTMFRLASHFTGFSTKTIAPRADKAVVITGCDSGFGHAVALQCHSLGYHVFAGCLQKDSISAWEGTDGLTPVLLDVCKEEDVRKLANLVLKWVKDGKEARYLHAVVNNAGIGNAGFVDWIDIDVYKKTMDVNFFGQVRMVQAFLPFLKDQQRNYHHARIVNMVSCAGLIPSDGMSPYTASKFAAEGFSQSLRLELRNYDLKVVTMNPSFHQTPLTQSLDQHLGKLWDTMNESTKEKYGEEYFHETFGLQARLLKYISLRAANVERDMVKAIDLVRPPLRILTGSDAKFLHVWASMLPDWVLDFTVFNHGQTPAFVKESKPATTNNKEKQT
mmetsp:Transcript_1580/g.2171  ORF Transcript_1580/g.2171 Transcript_1580/m.2171 type:complete len:382 (+) Transcript_1580:170-1315(+)|eukprot:CAMPEP_0178916328 /NCGR_PEP_ID=MMETSP0786-20121207/12561_1 /TAXON_ID=186022 /ORGANISM="Thalassionema frauenfeldii, Strain CCMP 1798" /LENGTH=381 /DNA_ID=CAMNT_0020589617 /DNA_START=151 /DNA_END=1296 /DNA_ORIENTATION=-